MPQDDNSSQVNNNPHQRREAFIGRSNMVLKKSFNSIKSDNSYISNNNENDSNNNVTNVSDTELCDMLSSTPVSSASASTSKEGGPSSVEDENPSWISELYNAWDEEIRTNMPYSKRVYFLKFQSDSEDEDDDSGPKRNTRFRNHMKNFIENEQTKAERRTDTRRSYFFAATDPNDDITPRVLKKPAEIELPPREMVLEKVTIDSSREKPRLPTKNIFQKLFSTAVTNSSTIPITLHGWINELMKYEQRLSRFINDSKLIIRSLKNKEQMERLFVYKELQFLKECRLLPVIRSFRKYYILRIMELQRKQQFEKAIKNILKARLQETKKAIDILNAVDETEDYRKMLPDYLTRNGYYFLNVEQIITTTKELTARRLFIRKLGELYKKAELEYNTTRKNYGAHKKCRPKREQQNILRNLVEEFKIPNVEAISEPVPWTEFLDIIANEKRCQQQREFNSVIGDLRSTEGQSIRTFVQELRNITFERVPPNEVLEYESSFTSYILKLNGLTVGKDPKKVEHITKNLSYLVHGFIFGDLIVRELEKVELLRNEDDDRYFVKQQKIVVNLEPIQLGVAQKFLPLHRGSITNEELLKKQNQIQSVNEPPYWQPIQVLSCLCFCITPAEMLHCIHMCARQIHFIAKRQCELREKEFTFGADEFFPLLVYVVSRAVLPTIHTNLALMAKFISASEREERPDVVYYLTCLEGAVMYVSGLTEDDVKNLTSDLSQEKKQSNAQSIVTTSSEDK
jgi:hypothetical protein